VTRLSLHGDYSTVRETALFQIFHLTVTLGLQGAACQFLPRHSPCCGTVAQDLACGARVRECVLAAYPTEWNHVVLHSMEAGNSSTTIVYCCTTLPPTQLRLSAAVVCLRVMWPRVYHQRARAHTHGRNIASEIAARGLLVATRVRPRRRG
jgi:hypothetical protein